MVIFNEGPEKYFRKGPNLESLLEFGMEHPEKVSYATKSNDFINQLAERYKELVKIFNNSYSTIRDVSDPKIEKLQNVVDEILTRIRKPIRIFKVPKELIGTHLLGMTIPSFDIPPVFINENQDAPERIKTLIHELLHILFPWYDELKIRELEAQYTNIN